MSIRTGWYLAFNLTLKVAGQQKCGPRQVQEVSFLGCAPPPHSPVYQVCPPERCVHTFNEVCRSRCVGSLYGMNTYFSSTGLLTFLRLAIALALTSHTSTPPDWMMPSCLCMCTGITVTCRVTEYMGMNTFIVCSKWSTEHSQYSVNHNS